MVLVLMAIFTGGFGVWSVMRNWRFHVETQLRLNQCVGKTALQLKSTLFSIENSNSRIKKLRMAIRAAQVAQPPLVPALQGALTLQVVQQETELIQWRHTQFKWIRARGCGGWRDRAQLLPTLHYYREPPDLVGPQELKWTGIVPVSLWIKVQNGSRVSGARVYEDNESSSRWKAFWSVSYGSNRAVFD
jgi:hypothetical protein